MQDLPIIAIFGPTAVGKTEVCLELADRLRARDLDPVAVSADALQVYRGLDVLTAKPSASQLKRLEHRLISFIAITEEYSAGRFQETARNEIDGLLAGGRTPIVVGGTGLYLRAAVAELSLGSAPPARVREKWELFYDTHGATQAHRELLRVNPAAVGVHPHDRKRVVRGLELAEMGEEQAMVERSELWSEKTRLPTASFGLTMQRDALYERIDERVDNMVERGAISEVRVALTAGASKTAAKALGFQEIAEHIEGRLSEAAMRKRIKRRTRNYARRQLTWMRKLPRVTLVERTGTTAGETADLIVGALCRPPCSDRPSPSD